MKKAFLIFGLMVGFFAFSAGSASAQQTPPELPVDPLMEIDAKANLDVARTYFRTRKAYKAVLLRFEETFEANPNFSRMDEFLYLAGMSSYYLSQNKGKQKITPAATEKEKQKYAPEKLREDAKMYLAMLVEKYPKSKYKDDAEKTLKELKK